MTLTEVEDTLVQRARSALEETAAKLALSGKVSTAVARGRASEEIVRTARETKASLIVIGTHGHTGISHVLLGSTAERVVRKAPCPVLTLRPDAG